MKINLISKNTMAYKDKRLAKLAMSNGKFIKLDVGDSFKGTYVTWKSVYDEKYKKTKVEFVFRDEKGDEKILGTSSKKVIGKMAKIIPGSELNLTKLGEDRQLDYSIKVLKEGKATTQHVPDEDEEEIEIVSQEEGINEIDEEENDEDELF